MFNEYDKKPIVYIIHMGSLDIIPLNHVCLEENKKSIKITINYTDNIKSHKYLILVYC